MGVSTSISRHHAAYLSPQVSFLWHRDIDTTPLIPYCIKRNQYQTDLPPVVRPPFKFVHADRREGAGLWGGWPIPQRTMRALRVVLTALALDEDLGFVQRIEEFSVQQLIPYVC